MPCVAAVPDQRPVAPRTCAQAVMSPRRAVAADTMASCVPQQANHPGSWRALDAKTRPVMAGHMGERRRKRAQRLGAKRPRASRQPAMLYPEPYGVSDGGMPAAQPRALRPFVRQPTPSARCNNTWRQRVARLGCEAWSCSKTLAHHMGAITRCMCHDNLTRAAASRAHDMECTTKIPATRIQRIGVRICVSSSEHNPIRSRGWLWRREEQPGRPCPTPQAASVRGRVTPVSDGHHRGFPTLGSVADRSNEIRSPPR
jgi:hypothetical protein